MATINLSHDEELSLLSEEEEFYVKNHFEKKTGYKFPNDCNKRKGKRKKTTIRMI
tara:strand:+ start:375 stop:539 length:165 start_codon:yes stop_codon:yes gene_type:complete